MKKLFSVLLIVVLLLSFTACKKEVAEPVAPVEPVTPVTTPTIPVIESDSDGVTITMPQSWLADNEDFDPEALEEEEGYTDVKVNDDGTVTYTMPRETYDIAMAEMRLSLETMFSEFQGDEGMPFIDSITYDDDFENITMMVDVTMYENPVAYDFFHNMIGTVVSMYHEMQDSELKCHYVVKDHKTGEILMDVMYPDDLTSIE